MSERAELPVEEVRLLQPMFGDDETVWEVQIRFATAQALGRWMDASSNELSSDRDEVPSPRAFANVVKGVELMAEATSPLYRLYSFETARTTATPAAAPKLSHESDAR